MSEVLKLKKSNCKNCYKCIRHCPVKSIRFSAGQAHIVAEDCILCGHCFVMCPQNAKEIIDDTERAKVLLSGEVPVYASLAPSFVANYNGARLADMEVALRALGFAAAEETAIGATIVKRAYDEILREGKKELLISSCCPTVNLLIQKHFPEALRFLAEVVTPMQAHAADIKRRNPNAKVIFIGPCLSKKEEGQREPKVVDCVLTFEELSRMLAEKGIAIQKTEPAQSEQTGKTRLFPTTGGILKSMDCDAGGYTYLAVDGVDNCIAMLKELSKGGLTGSFIEMSACAGSCIGGPVMERRDMPLLAYNKVNAYAGKEDFPVASVKEEEYHRHYPYLGSSKHMPGQQELAEILRKMGKPTPEYELNCGSCGYDTCRDKAVAIYQGKADLNMCLPFLKERAESFSDNIVNNTPNGIIVLNEDLEVQQVNRAACRIMNLRGASDVAGEQVVRILDPKPFLDVRQNGRDIQNERTYLAEYNRYVEMTVHYDREYHTLMCIMRDVTEEELQREKKESISRQTVEIADKVVDKQMRIVQEIASLLGETAAETKIALTKLKESVAEEGQR